MYSAKRGQAVFGSRPWWNPFLSAVQWVHRSATHHRPCGPHKMTLSLPISLNDILVGTRLLWSLPGFLRNPVAPEQAREILRLRLDQRDAAFLTLVRRSVYQHAASPYRELLRVAGCEYGDSETLVAQEGVEGALTTLFRRGVYLTIDEFKGRKPAIRGSATITVTPAGSETRSRPRISRPRAAGAGVRARLWASTSRTCETKRSIGGSFSMPAGAVIGSTPPGGFPVARPCVGSCGWVAAGFFRPPGSRRWILPLQICIPGTVGASASCA